MALTEMMVMYKTKGSEAWLKVSIPVISEEFEKMSSLRQKDFLKEKVTNYVIGDEVIDISFKKIEHEEEDSPRQFKSELLESSPPKWEYDIKIISGTPEQMLVTMNALGHLGWEAWYKSHNTNKVYFKRLIS